MKRGKDNSTLSLLILSNNKKINRGTPSKRKQKQHSNNQEQFDLIKGNKEGKASVNNLKDSKSNQKPPSSIQLRGKVNVEGRRCKEIEILRKIKASIEIVKGYENQSMFLICQEIKIEKSIGLERSKEKLFDICYCKENNKNCMKKASQLSYDTIEKELSKLNLMNAGRVSFPKKRGKVASRDNIREPVRKKIRDFLGVFPKCQTPPPHPPYLGGLRPKKN